MTSGARCAPRPRWAVHGGAINRGRHAPIVAGRTDRIIGHPLPPTVRTPSVPAQKDPRSEDIVTLQQAADRLGVSSLFLSEVIADGGFPARRVGRRYFISWPAVMRWVEGVDMAPAAPPVPRQRVVPPRPVKTQPPDPGTEAPAEPGDGG